MHPDLVATIYRQRMSTLVHDARSRRVARQLRGRQIAKGERPAA
jgi:hypothetical protein